MAERITFDYYYGVQSEQFSFFRVPRLIVKSELFSGLSNDAKLLYGLMIDRLSLSIKNNWFDDKNRAYIKYSIEDVAKDLNCKRDKAMKTINELDKEKGLGLIEKCRMGLGRANVIYVKNFAIQEALPEKIYEDKKEEENPCECTEVGNIDFKKSVNNMPEENRSEISTLRSRNYRPQEVDRTDSNYNNKSYNNESYIPHHQDGIESVEKKDEDEGKMKEIEYRDYLRERGGFSEIQASGDADLTFAADMVIEIILGIIADPGDAPLRVNGQLKDRKVVISRFLKITPEILQTVATAFADNKDTVRNAKSYLITALYNAFDHPQDYRKYTSKSEVNKNRLSFAGERDYSPEYWKEIEKQLLMT